MCLKVKAVSKPIGILISDALSLLVFSFLYMVQVI